MLIRWKNVDDEHAIQHLKWKVRNAIGFLGSAIYSLGISGRPSYCHADTECFLQLKILKSCGWSVARV